jgi:hypothetical protein
LDWILVRFGADDHPPRVTQFLVLIKVVSKSTCCEQVAHLSRDKQK